MQRDPKDVIKMSADLIVYHIFMWGCFKTDQDLRDRERRMIEETNNFLTEEDEDEYKENLREYANYDEDDNLDIKETIKNTIMNFFACLNGNDVSYQFHNKQTMWYTGGMSWGDNPTEACEKFEMFNCLPRRIKDAGGFLDF